MAYNLAEHPEKIFRERIFRMLGNHSPAEFLQLSPSAREQILRRSQVKENGPIIMDGGDTNRDLNFEMEGHALLRDANLVAQGEVGRQIAEEATRLHYSSNSFRVESSCLGQFLGQCQREGGQIRRIFVDVVLGHPDERNGSYARYDENGIRPHRDLNDVRNEDFDRHFWERGAQQVPRAVHHLRYLTHLNDPEYVYVNIVGRSTIRRSDLETQLQIREISRVVKRLSQTLGNRLHVLKVTGFDVNTWTSFEWDRSYAILGGTDL
ncbi:hypothetical protein OHC33_009127 [Knufia fluminis]|uniref:Uncharacterized protein n=1 Tax=Knufia fluminis TaxID=191047 RepID=A0AAN8IJ97_9EURO|nr:hypothetical protein OHC33_009127 [Knufia fluminis]